MLKNHNVPHYCFTKIPNPFHYQQIMDFLNISKKLDTRKNYFCFGNFF